VAEGRGGFSHFKKSLQETASTTKIYFKSRIFSSFGGVAEGLGGFSHFPNFHKKPQKQFSNFRFFGG